MKPLGFLATVPRMLVGSLDYSTTSSCVAQLVTPELDAIGVVEDRVPRLFAAVRRLPATIEIWVRGALVHRLVE